MKTGWLLKCALCEFINESTRNIIRWWRRRRKMVTKRMWKNTHDAKEVFHGKAFVCKFLHVVCSCKMLCCFKSLSLSFSLSYGLWEFRYYYISICKRCRKKLFPVMKHFFFRRSLCVRIIVGWFGFLLCCYVLRVRNVCRGRFKCDNSLKINVYENEISHGTNG